MKIIWSAIFVLAASAAIEVLGAPNPIQRVPSNPINITRTTRDVKCHQLLLVNGGGFYFFPGQVETIRSSGRLGIKGCIEIVRDSKKGKVDSGFVFASKTKDQHKYEIVDLL